MIKRIEQIKKRLKNNCKIYVDLEFHKDEMKNLIEENKELKELLKNY